MFFPKMERFFPRIGLKNLAEKASIFANPPTLIVELFHEVLQEATIQGHFKKVVFAIYCPKTSEEANYQAFQEKFGGCTS